MIGTIRLKRLLLLGCCLVFLLLAASCQFYRSPFTRTTQSIGSAFAAARATLRYVHEGKMPRASARSVFAGYARQLQNAPQQLIPEQGSPTRPVLIRLLAVYQATMPVIKHPCLQATCDWQRQIATLKKAYDAFAEASNS